MWPRGNRKQGRMWLKCIIGLLKMVSSSIFASSYGLYGLLEVDRPSLPAVFHSEDFSYDDSRGLTVGELQVFGVTVGSSVNAGKASILSVKEAKTKVLQAAMEDTQAKADLLIEHCSQTLELSPK